MVVLKFSLCIINANNTTLNNALLMLSTKQMLFLMGRTRFDPVVAVHMVQMRSVYLIL